MTDEQQAEIVERALAGQLIVCTSKEPYAQGSCGQAFLEWRRKGPGCRICPWCAVHAMEAIDVTFPNYPLTPREREHLAEARIECDRQAWLKA